MEGTAIDGHPSPDELQRRRMDLACAEDARERPFLNAYAVDQPERMTHVRLCQYPDGGVARLRVHGDVVPDPRFLSTGTVDRPRWRTVARSAAAATCSTLTHEPDLARPGASHGGGLGRPPSTRRSERLGRVRSPDPASCGSLNSTRVTSWVTPGLGEPEGCDARVANPGGPDRVDRDPFPAHVCSPIPDTGSGCQRSEGDARPAGRVPRRGGMARVRLRGDLSASGREDLVVRWFNLLPEGHAKAVLAEDAGLTGGDAEKAVANRPAKTLADLPSALRNGLAG